MPPFFCLWCQVIKRILSISVRVNPGVGSAESDVALEKSGSCNFFNTRNWKSSCFVYTQHECLNSHNWQRRLSQPTAADLEWQPSLEVRDDRFKWITGLIKYSFVSRDCKWQTKTKMNFGLFYLQRHSPLIEKQLLPANKEQGRGRRQWEPALLCMGKSVAYLYNLISLFAFTSEARNGMKNLVT